MSDDPFSVLGVGRDVDLTVAKRAYIRLVKAHPPESDPEGFQRVRAAWEAVEAQLKQSAASEMPAAGGSADAAPGTTVATFPPRESPQPAPPLPASYRDFLAAHGAMLSPSQRACFEEQGDPRDIVLVALQLEKANNPKQAGALASALLSACRERDVEPPIGDILALTVRLARRRATTTAKNIFETVRALVVTAGGFENAVSGDVELRRLGYMRYRYLTVFFDGEGSVPYSVLDEVVALAAAPFSYDLSALERTIAQLPRDAINKYRKLQKREPELFPPVAAGWLLRFTHNPDDSGVARLIGCGTVILIVLVVVAVKAGVAMLFK